MSDSGRNLRPSPGPFGMGTQGYLIIALIIVGTALYTMTRGDWTSMLISALGFPLIMIALVHILSRFRWNEPHLRGRRREPGQGVDLLTILVRTNPFTFFLAGLLSRGVDDDRYQELLQSGPYGMGQYGYFIVLAVVIGPLIVALILMALTGQLPAHLAPHFS